jgi:hypothetical protein
MQHFPHKYRLTKKSQLKTLITILAGVAVLFSCKREEAPIPQTQEVSVEQSQIKTITVNGSSYKLRLDSVKDSRCPLDAVCISQGHAIAFINMATSTGVFYNFRLGTMPPLNPPANLPANDTTIFGVNIKLLEVTPLPMLSQPNLPKTIKLLVQ